MASKHGKLLLVLFSIIVLFASTASANKYYTHSGWPVYGSQGTSATARAEMELIQTGFTDVEADLAAAGYVPYGTTFTNADLAAGILTVTHSLDNQYPSGVTVYDNSGVAVHVQVTTVGANSLTIDLSAAGTLTGTWRVRVRY